jgi:hypothetical protein
MGYRSATVPGPGSAPLRLGPAENSETKEMRG